MILVVCMIFEIEGGRYQFWISLLIFPDRADREWRSFLGPTPDRQNKLPAYKLSAKHSL